MANTQIGIGMAAIGRPEYINIRENTHINKSEAAFKTNAFSVLDAAYANGIRYFDTAASYGKGEQFLIEWNTSRKHTDVSLSTKWGYTYVADWELGYMGKHEVKEHSLTKLLEQWEQSKKLLPNLKIHQIHSATLESGVLTNQAVLKKLFEIKQSTGLQIGLSTSGINQTEVIEKALAVTVQNIMLFDSFQVTYNVLEQSTFKRLKALNKTVIVKEALANGRMFLKQNKSNATLSALAEKYQVGIDAVALRFVIDTLQPTYVLSGAANANQLNQNLKAQTFHLTVDEIMELKSLEMNARKYWGERSQLEWG